jgi:arabinogalactan endo-1,4-beta-galactosidase
MKWTRFLFPAFFILSAPAWATPLYFGGDLSFANQMNDCGAVYSDQGTAKDVYAIFKDHGANLIRIRLWTDGNQTNYSNFADVEKSIRRAKAAGMQVLLDFHYSDSWADGGKQVIPKAWAGITDNAALAQTLYQYTYDTLTKLDHDGLMPEIVQVGNEINSEMLEQPDEKPHPIDWARNAMLINAGIRGVRDAGAKSSIKPRVMLHIAQPENAEPWFAAATKAGVTDYDIIGLSYYSKWSKYLIAGLGTEIYRLRHIYPKADVMVVETAYLWTARWKDNYANALGEDSLFPGYRATPEGQKKFLQDVVQAVLSNGGDGVIYWAPDWVSTDCMLQWGRGSGWENATLFDFDNAALPGLDFMTPQKDEQKN